MRLINRLLATLLIATATLIAGCEKPAPLPNEKSMAVTYATLDGSWQLTMWQGTPMAEDTYLYIEFDRREHRYTMWDNIDSMYATDTTGTFTITEEEDGTYTLSGSIMPIVGFWTGVSVGSLSQLHPASATTAATRATAKCLIFIVLCLLF